jgi:hypothetical protein
MRGCGSVALLLDGCQSCLCWIFCKFVLRAVHLLALHWLRARWNVGLRTPDCTLPPTVPILTAIIAAIWWQWWDWLNRSPVQCAALCHLATELALPNHHFRWLWSLLSWCYCRPHSVHACESSNKTHGEADDSCILISPVSSWNAKVK